MKMRIASLSLLAVCLTLAAVPAMAQADIYDNGPLNGQTLGWTINFGFEVTDSFFVNQNFTVNGMQFWNWLIPGDTLTSVEMDISASPFGNELADLVLTPTASNCFTNGFGYNVCDETATFAGISLNSGTYWMTLTNAIVPSGDPTYWDMNSGPSLAQENTVGTIPSESFTILGAYQTSTTSASSTTGTTPEPSSIMLLGSGILGLAGILRRKLF